MPARVRQHIVSYTELDDPTELSPDEAQLLHAARQAASQAHAPYSHFRVGCSLLLSTGEVLTGNNQENVAFPSGLCAERVALFYAGAMGKVQQVRKIAVWAASEVAPDASIPTSCGACRQVMVEYEKQGSEPWIILFQGASGHILRMEGVATSLVPFAFEGRF